MSLTFSRVLIFGLLLALLFPRVLAGGVWVGLDDLICLALLAIWPVKKIWHGYLARNELVVLPLLVFVFMYLILGVVQTFSYIGSVQVPTELWQFLKRALIFILVSEYYFSAPESERRSLVRLVLVFSVGYLLIGVMQYVGVTYLVHLYGRTDGQERLAENIVSKRIYGVSGISISWGAMSANIVIMSAVFLFSLRAYRSRGFIALFAVLVFVLALFNMIFSGARSAYLGVVLLFVLSIVLLVKDFLFRKWRQVFSTSLVLIFVLIGAILVAQSLQEQIEFLIYRFSVLSDSGGGGRMDQIQQGLALLRNPGEWLFGVSNAVQRKFGVWHGIEAEPINILVNYGIIGFCLIYSPLAFIVAALYKSKSVVLRRGGIALVVNCLACSLAYFFFQELIVGAYVWMGLGIFYAAALSELRQREVFVKNGVAAFVQRQ